ETASGLLLLSFHLETADGQRSIDMEDNMFICEPDSLGDLEINARATRVKAWLPAGGIGLELTVSRITVANLERMLAADHRRLQRLAKIKDKHDSGGIGYQGQAIKKWAMDKAMDDEGRIALLNFKTLIVHFAGQQVRIRGGYI